MVESLAPLVSVDELYDYRGPEPVPLWSPYHQGDVFRDVELPGLPPIDDARERLAMLFLHPCTMRDGPGIREFVTVVRVKQKSARKIVSDSAYWEKRYKVMPLPDLLADGHSTHEADFLELATVASAALPRAQRVAQLSAHGRLLMQQRLVFHLTRHAPSLDVLAEATAHVETEAQGQADWVEAGLRHSTTPQDPSEVDRLEVEFQAFLGDGDDPGSWRSLLVGTSRSDAVRAIQREIALKYPN